MANDLRTPQQLSEHYEIEKRLADRLRNAPKAERRSLYNVVYDELARRVPHHPMLTERLTPEQAAISVGNQMRLLSRFLKMDSVFLELGPGACAISLKVAESVKQVYAVDVTSEFISTMEKPSNFHFALSDGCSVPVPAGGVSIAYSNQLMEHLHPEDALEQLQNIYRALQRGGAYLCITPNRLTGPHDISMYFDEVATGFHLKEYTISELRTLFKTVGFSKLKFFVGGRGSYVAIPILFLVFIEKVLGALPSGLSKRLAHAQPLRALLNIRILGEK